MRYQKKYTLRRKAAANEVNTKWPTNVQKSTDELSHDLFGSHIPSGANLIYPVRTMRSNTVVITPQAASKH